MRLVEEEWPVCINNKLQLGVFNLTKDRLPIYLHKKRGFVADEDLRRIVAHRNSVWRFGLVHTCDQTVQRDRDGRIRRQKRPRQLIHLVGGGGVERGKV